MQCHASLPGDELLAKKLACRHKLIGVNRWLYELSPTTEQKTQLAKTMNTCGETLLGATEDYDGLSSAWEELVAADFRLCRANPGDQRRLLASLHEYRDSLDDTDRADKACAALQKLANSGRDLYDENTEFGTLHELSWCLRRLFVGGRPSGRSKRCMGRTCYCPRQAICSCYGVLKTLGRAGRGRRGGALCTSTEACT